MLARLLIMVFCLDMSDWLAKRYLFQLYHRRPTVTGAVVFHMFSRTFAKPVIAKDILIGLSVSPPLNILDLITTCFIPKINLNSRIAKMIICALFAKCTGGQAGAAKIKSQFSWLAIAGRTLNDLEEALQYE